MSSGMLSTLYVALGGATGSVLRFWIGGLIAVKAGAPLWGTLFVNITGSFCIGFVAAFASEHPAVRFFLMLGVLGGFTTFSAFSLQTLDLLQKGHVALALANVALSIILCLLGVWLGWIAGRAIA